MRKGVRYTSTRSPLDCSFTETLLAGLAPDGGLYMPQEYPQLDIKGEHLAGLRYAQIAKEVLAPYMPDIPVDDLVTLLNRTYRAGIFGSEQITPVHWLADDLGLLKLSGGPTLAFKDVSLQLLARLMAYSSRGETINIVGATSGDTGSAAEYAVVGYDNITVFMLSPHGRMSEFQQRQMYTLQERNIHNLEINGTFDDCQDVVKEINADASFKERYRISAFNSINWARIIIQAVYYFVATARRPKGMKEVSFVIPSGNFGNAFAAYVARKMGAPIREIIVATNENDILDEFFRTGVYRVRKDAEVVVTSSPSMDIAKASNFERLVYEMVHRDHELIVQLWEELSRTGQFDGNFLLPQHNAQMRSGSATQAQVLETIRAIYATKWKAIIDPHTAVAMKVAMEQRGSSPLIVAETADPAKFAPAILQALGIKPPVPANYAKLADLPMHTTRMDPDPAKVKEYIQTHAKAA